MRYALWILVCAVVGSPLFLGSAHGQYFGGDGAPLTQEQLDKCEQYDISPCTQNNILAKERLMAAQSQTSYDEGYIPLTATSNGNSYIVNIYWKPDDIRQTNSFDIYFYETGRSGDPIFAEYDIVLYKDGEYMPPSQRSNQYYYAQNYTFDEEGSYSIRLENINNSGERVEIPIQVTPEFPLGILGALVGTMMGMAIVMSRYHMPHT